jgi:hypothetical protein
MLTTTTTTTRAAAAAVAVVVVEFMHYQRFNKYLVPKYTVPTNKCS